MCKKRKSKYTNDETRVGNKSNSFACDFVDFNH